MHEQMSSLHVPINHSPKSYPNLFIQTHQSFLYHTSYKSVLWCCFRITDNVYQLSKIGKAHSRYNIKASYYMEIT